MSQSLKFEMISILVLKILTFLVFKNENQNVILLLKKFVRLK